MGDKTGDLILLAAAALLLSFGLVMGTSASAAIALEQFQDPYYYLKRQLVFAVVGTLFLVAALRTDPQQWRKWVYPLLVLTFLALVVVLIPWIGREVGGARRWLRLGPVSLQPAELAKFTAILYTAHSLDKRGERIEDFTFGYMPNLVVLSLFFVLLLLEPDLGTALVLAIVVLSLLLVGGARLSHLVATGLMSLPFLYVAIEGTAYRRRRILAFLDPWGDPQDSGFQLIQSFLAFGKGGFWGLGLGEGRQKLFYLPEPHTDFIFSVVGEELGFIGATAVVVLFAVLVWRGFRIAQRCREPFRRYLAFGVTLGIAVQALINMGVVMGMLPTKGLALPFVSMGGSSLVMNLMMVGILLNLSRTQQG